MAALAAEAGEEGGEVVFFGAVDWSAVGRVDAKKKGGGSKADVPSLPAPHRLKGLAGVSISFVASGCSEGPLPMLPLGPLIPSPVSTLAPDREV